MERSILEGNDEADDFSLFVFTVLFAFNNSVFLSTS